MTRSWEYRLLVPMALFALLAPSWAQQQPARAASDWARIGNAAVDAGLGGLSTGAVSRVWYSEDGSTLYARTSLGSIYATEDFETWTSAPTVKAPELPPQARAARLPESNAPVRVQVREGGRGRLYAAGTFVYRSEDGGVNWSNLTSYRGLSILGNGPVFDFAVSPQEADDITVASGTGVWRSVDGGLSWNSLNAGLPNLTLNRILAVPIGVRGVRIASGASAFEWAPGERTAWRPVEDAGFTAELTLNARLSTSFGVRINASATAGDTVYAGATDGRIYASNDAGASWTSFRLPEAGVIERIVIDPQDSRMAIAVAGERPVDLAPQTRGIHVLRTINGGVFWDDLTANLPDVAAHGVAFERSSGGVYVATDGGVYWTKADLNGLGPASGWQRAGSGLPDAVPAMDVRLDAGANQLFAGLAGLGVYATAAPHRKLVPRVANAADYSSRAAAPGSVLTVFGSAVRAAAAGGVEAPVLAANELRSEIQIPFDARGPVVNLVLDAGGGSSFRVGLPVESVSPAIFIDRDGTPMILDGDSGALVDASSAARAGGRVQILSSGLGRVSPDWPAGAKAPLDNPPSVVARVRAFFDGRETGVTKAVLAPGYIGMYLVEIQLPSIVNRGAAELMISIEGKESNRVRIYVEP